MGATSSPAGRCISAIALISSRSAPPSSHHFAARHQSRSLLSHIGDVLMIQVRMVERVEISEKPDLLWGLPQ
ncbi:hypothetical protein JWG42_12245 [Desulfoprunum benzoelyticum]|jgi:hypothetical protein|uniref:Uncharacterized protein n=1 Tax=Desulfoprunum benzoelyticum TaxID=1506996 RepID=A0A840V2N1_9BACT|nr:hypothetical protein [Desulfoprunum benzoelyticum]MBB5347401.1 hypothetical protein [Desulfoprunum benzoelyticum]MBM9530922.1 hypothetical protein [Desulfoprunum benzoelyticum]